MPRELGAVSRSRHDASARDGHLGLWLMREPEMDVGRVFAGRGRSLATLWNAVLVEWLEATFMLSDPGVAQAKLAWWGEALLQPPDVAEHPLLRAFLSESAGVVAAAGWRALTNAAITLTALEASPGDVSALLASRHELARAVVAIEDVLWPQCGTGDPVAVARSLLLWQWRWHEPGETARPPWLPLQLLARHGLRTQAAYAGEDDEVHARLLADLADAVLGLPVREAGPRLRRIRTRLDGQSLRRFAARHPRPFPVSGFGLLRDCWRAARGVPA